jgi:hypothetical protein
MLCPDYDWSGVLMWKWFTRRELIARYVQASEHEGIPAGRTAKANLPARTVTFERRVESLRDSQAVK